jgi:hypothetical protein
MCFRQLEQELVAEKSRAAAAEATTFKSNSGLTYHCLQVRAIAAEKIALQAEKRAARRARTRHKTSSGSAFKPLFFHSVDEHARQITIKLADK